MGLNKYDGLKVSIEGHFENSSRSYEYFLHPKMLRIFVNWLLYNMDYRQLSLDFEKDVFYSYIDTPYGKNKKFYFTNVHLLGTYDFKVRDTKATKFINEVFFEEDRYELALSESYLKDAGLTDRDVENLFSKDFPQFFGEDKVTVFKFDNDYKLNEGEDNSMMKTDSVEKRGFNIPGLKNVGKQLTGVFAFSMITQKLAVKMDGGYFSFDKETKALTDETGFAMEVPFPAMILPERFSKLKAGDLVISPDGGKLVYVVDVDAEAKTYNYVGANGIVQSAAKVQNAVMKDMDFVEKVINPLADAFDSSEDDGLFDNPMMMMALMGNGGNIFGGGNGSNNDMMSMLMLSKMMKK
ncbi:MAG: hypothetical protein ABS916_10020 [Carnobacterium sp.]|uniref:hypothetical protein n=1 Tax=Carnobacterium sp. TaxID=48221 RepID=UPI00331607F7